LLISTPSATYTYNKNGNPYNKVDATGTTSYTWDFDNRLTKVIAPRLNRKGAMLVLGLLVIIDVVLLLLVSPMHELP